MGNYHPIPFEYTCSDDVCNPFVVQKFLLFESSDVVLIYRRVLETDDFGKHWGVQRIFNLLTETCINDIPYCCPTKYNLRPLSLDSAREYLKYEGYVKQLLCRDQEGIGHIYKLQEPLKRVSHLSKDNIMSSNDPPYFFEPDKTKFFVVTQLENSHESVLRAMYQ